MRVSFISTFDGELVEFLRKINTRYEGRPVLREIAEEYAEDIPIASEDIGPRTLNRGVVRVKRSEALSSDLRFKYFIDGVVETRPIHRINVSGVRVPIHMVVCGAGVFERNSNGELRPTDKMIFLPFLALPYRALKDLDKDFPELPANSELIRLKPLVDRIRGKVLKNLWLDTSVSFGTEERVLEKHDLLITGRVRAKARDQARVIMRVLEVGALYMLKKDGHNGLVVFDGPLSPLHIYANLASEEIRGLYMLSDTNISYDMLRDVVGAVKRVHKIPYDDAIYTIFERTPDEQVFIVYQMEEVVKPLKGDEDDTRLEDVMKATLSAFTLLRPELGEVYEERIVSNMSMVARFDIPLPNIAEKSEEWYLADFAEKVFKEVFLEGTVNLSNNRGKRLHELLKAITAERYPVPSAHGAREFTELYPIYEAERWLKAYLKGLQYDALSILF